MNLVTRALESVGTALRSFWLPPMWSRDPALTQYFGYGPTTAGMNVTEQTALTYSAWWGAVQIIANTVASLPLFLYKRSASGEEAKDKFTSHPVYRLLTDDFNREMTSFVARRTMMAHVLTWGNAFAEIERNGGGVPVNLWPISPPNRVWPDRDDQGNLIYRVIQPKTQREVIVSAEDMLHVKGQSFDGIIGYSIVRQARETIGLGMAQETFGAQFFNNGATASIVATHPGVLSDAAHARLKQAILENTTGGKRHSVLLLEEGITVEKLTIPPEDAQFLASRNFSVLEVCRWFNLPPHKLAQLERATFTNVEHMAIEFMQDCIQPWLIAWEQELDRKLIRPLERLQQFTKHKVDALLRGDFPTRVQGYATMRQWGLMNADEIRALEEMNPLPKGQGQIYLTPINMAPADRLNEIVDKQVAPGAPPPPKPGAPSATAPAPGARPRQAELIAAHRAVLVDALQRMVRKEAQAARRAAKRGVPAFDNWSDAFYPKHERDIAQVIRAAMQAYVAQLGSGEPAETAAADLARTYVDASREELATLTAAPNELENAVDLVARRWEQTRAEQLADGLMTEEVRHALAHAE